jgi:hypothetical protein
VGIFKKIGSRLLRSLRGLVRLLGKITLGFVQGLVALMVIVGLTMIVKSTCVLIDQIAEIEVPVEGTFTMEKMPPFKASEMGTEPKKAKNGMIAIYRKDDKGKWQFNCTAFVVTNVYAMTAGHCLNDHKTGYLTKEAIQVRLLDLKETTMIVHAASMNITADIGIVTGDFRQFQKNYINRDGFFGLKGPFVTCGFPYGDSPPQCIPFVPQSNYRFAIKGQGFVYPGMSGGPTYDVTTHMVVGINAAAGDGFVLVAPMIGFLGALELKLDK